nr:hypothetical protein [Tanacetum cinerariifolium]GEW56308.1 hypothetical protein [Tanacetum cinerariifolium]
MAEIGFFRRRYSRLSIQSGVAEPKKKQDVLNSNVQQKQKTDEAAKILQEKIFNAHAATIVLNFSCGPFKE